MPRVSLLVPFRDDDGTRTRLWDWLRPRWEHYHPDVEIVVATDESAPFSKTSAVNDAARRASGDVFGILDADVWFHAAGFSHAVDLVATRRVPWCAPHSRVIRITEAATDRILDLDPTVRFPRLDLTRDAERVTPTSLGMLYLVRRDDFERVGGMDPRFAGWGWEDNAFQWVLDALVGPWRRLDYDAFHLWHPRHRNEGGKPIWPGQTDRNAELGRRYKAARRDLRAMRQLVDEVRDLTGFGSR